MIKEIIDCFQKWALKHKDVHTFKYQDEMLINSQPNNKPYSVIIETDGYFQSVRDNHTLSINMDILGFVDVDEVTTQDIACQIGLSLINKVVDENRNLLALRDYSILLFTKKTGDRCSGARFTINFVVPSFIDWCTEQDNWV